MPHARTDSLGLQDALCWYFGSSSNSHGALQVRVLQEENAAIMRMVAALQPHKFSFTLEPAENLTSLADGFCSGEFPCQMHEGTVNLLLSPAKAESFMEDLREFACWSVKKNAWMQAVIALLSPSVLVPLTACSKSRLSRLTSSSFCSWCILTEQWTSSTSSLVVTSMEAEALGHENAIQHS